MEARRRIVGRVELSLTKLIIKKKQKRISNWMEN
jgi:hypothetical protein